MEFLLLAFQQLGPIAYKSQKADPICGQGC